MYGSGDMVELKEPRNSNYREVNLLEVLGAGFRV